MALSSVAASLIARAQEDVDSPYNYIPTRYVTILMVVLFSVSTIAHTGQALYYRTWFLLPTACLCGIGEIIGWSGRLWSSISPLQNTPFMMQISVTILAPTPLVAANFVILGRLIAYLGPQYSRLAPKWYTIIFCTCDVVALVIQGVGGGMAASADTPAGAQQGANTMLGGIVFQLAAIVIYSLLGIEFFVRYFKNKPARSVPASYTESGKPTFARGRMTQRLKLMSAALAFSTTLLFIRAIYRTIELQDGWNGRIISTEVYFNVLDGAMIVLAIFTLNFVHPGVFLLNAPSSDNDSEATYSGTQMGHAGK